MPQRAAVARDDRLAVDRGGAPPPRAIRPVAHPGYRPRTTGDRDEAAWEVDRGRRVAEIDAARRGAGAGVPGRRTVTITGRGAERVAPRRVDRDRRPAQRRHERMGFQPDRAALWAVMLGVLLILAAVASAHP